MSKKEFNENPSDIPSISTGKSESNFSPLPLSESSHLKPRRSRPGSGSRHSRDARGSPRLTVSFEIPREQAPEKLRDQIHKYFENKRSIAQDVHEGKIPAIKYYA